jgi:mRNA-degrading endonuclease toxin of MazEF toxin-antitoxin module
MNPAEVWWVSFEPPVGGEIRKSWPAPPVQLGLGASFCRPMATP